MEVTPQASIIPTVELDLDNPDQLTNDNYHPNEHRFENSIEFSHIVSIYGMQAWMCVCRVCCERRGGRGLMVKVMWKTGDNRIHVM